jgi:hypothetical protein
MSIEIGKILPIFVQLYKYRDEAYDVYNFTPFESQGSGEAVRLDEFEVPR